MRLSAISTIIAIALPFVRAGVQKPLDIEVTHAVECERKAKVGDSIEVHYKGTLLDGTKFDSSYDRNSPLPLTLGTGQVIRGWDEGLKDMCEGEKRLLTIQPEWAYGDRAMGPIPKNSVLVFETEMVKITPPRDEL